MTPRRAVLLLALLLTACGDETPAPQVAAPTATTQPPEHTLANQGAELYVRHCAACHAAGPGHPGTMRLNARLGPAQAVLVARHDLSAEYVLQIVRNGLEMMPPFRPSEISAAEGAAIATYVSAPGRPE